MLTIHGLSDFHRKITVNVRTPSTYSLMCLRLVWQPSANQRFGYSIQICAIYLSYFPCLTVSGAWKFEALWNCHDFTIQNLIFRCSYLENLDKHWYSISSKLVWKTQIHARYNIAVFKNLIINVLEKLRNFRKPLTLYKCMKKWYISQTFSIFSTRYKKWSIRVVV